MENFGDVGVEIHGHVALLETQHRRQAVALNVVLETRRITRCGWSGPRPRAAPLR